MTAVSTVSYYHFRNLPPEEIDKQDPTNKNREL